MIRKPGDSLDQCEHSDIADGHDYTHWYRKPGDSFNPRGHSDIADGYDYTHWYRKPGDSFDPCGHLDIATVMITHIGTGSQVTVSTYVDI